MLAAAAIVVVAGIGIGVNIAIGSHHAGAGPAPAVYSSGAGSLAGEWRVVAATAHGSDVGLAARPAITLTFESDGTLGIDDGVNVTTAAVRVQAGAFTARYRGTTFVADGSASDPRRRAVLQLLDSIAPGATPSAADNRYVIDGQHLTIQTSAGVLQLVRLRTAVPPVPAVSATPAG